MKTSLNKKDIIWNYISKAFTIGAGLITLPIILVNLSESEIALNYIFLNVVSFSVLFDFGFSPQFSRNFAYIISGANSIQNKGISLNHHADTIDYHLLKVVIESAIYIYKRFSLLLTLILLTIGTIYIHRVTHGFILVNNTLIMWIIFALASGVDFFYKFYTPLLQAKGYIAEVNKIEVFSNLIKIFFTWFLILLGFGLWSVIVGIISKVIIIRFYSYNLFYTEELKKEFRKHKINQIEIKTTIEKILYNAKRAGLVQLASFASTQLGFFYIGVFLSVKEVASYGLLMQLVSVISTVSLSLGYSSIPFFSTFRVNNNIVALKENFTYVLGMFYLIYIAGAVCILFIVPYCLDMIRSNSNLPSLLIVSIYLLYKFLEGQHCLCTCFLTTKNIIVDFESALILGLLSALLLYIGLKYSNFGLLGLVTSQFLLAAFYPNWKWPYEVCRDLQMSYTSLVCLSIRQVKKRSLSTLKR